MSDVTKLQGRVRRTFAYMTNVYNSDASKTSTEVRILRTGRCLIDFYQMVCDVYVETAGAKLDVNYQKHPWDSICRWIVNIVGYEELDKIYYHYSDRTGVDTLRVCAGGSVVNHPRNRFAHGYAFAEGLDRYEISDSNMVMLAAIYITVHRQANLTPAMSYVEFGSVFLNILKRGVR